MEGPIDDRPKVSVRAMDFEHFKNRFGINDKYHIIEVLRAMPRLSDEIQDEWNRRDPTDNVTKSNTSALADSMPSDLEWIQRVRIQSSMILGYLNHVAGSPGWDIEEPRVFFLAARGTEPLLSRNETISRHIGKAMGRSYATRRLWIFQGRFSYEKE